MYIALTEGSIPVGTEYFQRPSHASDGRHALERDEGADVALLPPVLHLAPLREEVAVPPGREFGHAFARAGLERWSTVSGGSRVRGLADSQPLDQRRAHVEPRDELEHIEAASRDLPSAEEAGDEARDHGGRCACS